jgi:hypothetical protein
MYDIIPAEVLDRIGRAYERAVARATERYSHWSADEDKATGGVGGTMEQLVKGQKTVDGRSYRWNTTQWALLGKSKKSAEREYGADVVIEIELRDEEDQTIVKKVLPVQNKKEKVYDNAKLAEQAGQLNQLPGGGLVVSFSERGFVSCEAGVVSEAGGAWSKIPGSQKSDFGRALSQDFLRCKVGSWDIDFLARQQVFRTKDGHEIHLEIPRTIKTLIKRKTTST